MTRVPHVKNVSFSVCDICTTTAGTGEDWSPTFRLGGPTTYWSPNFLAVVFKKQEISQQVVTRMQDLASEFSKIFRGCYPRTLTAGGDKPLPHPTPSPAFGRTRDVGTQKLVPLNISAVVAPLVYEMSPDCWRPRFFLSLAASLIACFVYVA